jgi:hypothetical protein
MHSRLTVYYGAFMERQIALYLHSGTVESRKSSNIPHFLITMINYAVFTGQVCKENCCLIIKE